MSEPIDHRAEAERYARYARELWEVNSTESAQAAAVSQAHSALAAEMDTDKGYWEQARRLEELIAAVRVVIGTAVYNVQREEYAIRRPVVLDRLAQLIEANES